MDILILTSHAYCMPYCVMLTSLIHNTPGIDLVLHVMEGPGLTSEDKNAIIKTVGNNNKVLFYELGDMLESLIAKLPTDRKDRITSVYSKLFVDQILPSSIDKVLWLDGDMIVRHSIVDLWNTDITDYPIAYVRDVGNNNVEFYNRLGYSYNDGYFNTGVILYNLKYWRQNNVNKDIMNVLEYDSNRISILDQDVLSLVFHKKKKVLPFKYNFQTWFLLKNKFIQISIPDYGEDIMKASVDPVIYHYIGSDKPWMYICDQPGIKEWESYQNMTVWGGIKIKNQRFFIKKTRSLIKKLLKRPGNKMFRGYVPPFLE